MERSTLDAGIGMGSRWRTCARSKPWRCGLRH
ncbi:Uncharacterised protein [Bordetella pertussis]|nr:Uncharacterised protein [Bordetella pertussis]